MTVFYLKLITGEEIIGEAVRLDKIVGVTDPMTLEYGESDGKRMVYMGRYNPFAENKTIYVDRRNVVWMRPVAAEVREYYSSSLRYAREVSDEAFLRGMRLASKSIHDETVQETEPNSEESTTGQTIH